MRVLVALAAAFAIGVAHMSMQFPTPRDKLKGAGYAVWQQNEPMVGVHPTVCHGLDKDATVRAGNAFAAGDVITIDIYGSASHNGGHCSFWYSLDEVTWTKIIDVKDCTTMAAGTIKVQLPAALPTECATKCAFAWTWSPVSSGACEVYMNCADISVSGVTGAGALPIQVDFAKIAAGTTACVRVDPGTHWTSILGDVKTMYAGDDGSATGNTVKPDPVDIEDSIESKPGAMCPNPNAPNKDGVIDSTNGTCTRANSRCDDDQCCSEAGYCGPEKAANTAQGNAQYKDYTTDSTGNTMYGSTELAFNAYCNKNQGDWRLVECVTGPKSSGPPGGSDDGDDKDSTALVSVVASAVLGIAAALYQ